MGISDHAQNAADATLAAAGSKAAYTGGSTAVIGWAMSSEVAAMLGVLIGIAGLLVNWYYRHKQDRREQREHEARLKGIYGDDE